MGLAQLLVEHRTAEERQRRQSAAAVGGVGGVGSGHHQRCGPRQRADPATGKAGRDGDHPVLDAGVVERRAQLPGTDGVDVQGPVRGGQLVVAGAVRGEVHHQQVVVAVHPGGQRPDGALQVQRCCPGIGVAGAGAVDQLQHASLGVEALGQHRGDHAALAQEHLFVGVGSEHQSVDIGHARPLRRQRCNRPLPDRLLGLENFLAQFQRRPLRCIFLRDVLLPRPVRELPGRQPEQRGQSECERRPAQATGAEVRGEPNGNADHPGHQQQVHGPAGPRPAPDPGRQLPMRLGDADQLRHRVGRH